MKRRAGYSVFEVLIAFTIMSLVLSALLPGQAKLLSQALESESALLAHDVALSRLARLGTSEELTSGQMILEDGPWRIVQRVLQSANSSVDLDVFDIVIAVEDANQRELARITAERSVAR